MESRDGTVGDLVAGCRPVDSPFHRIRLPMLRHHLLPILAALLAVPAAAQQTVGVQTKAPLAGTYSLTQGFQPAPSVGARSGPLTKYSNYDMDELYFSAGYQQASGAIVGWGPNDEKIDQAAFPAAGINAGNGGREQVNGLFFQYCSTMPDPLMTGDVLPVDVYFYEDYISGGSPTNWPIALCEYQLNLPGDNGTGTFQCWDITFEMTFGMECSLPQELNPGAGAAGLEQFGIGWVYGDPNPYPAGQTGPVVDSVQGGNPLGYGSLDETQLHDRAAMTRVGGLIGGQPFFQDAHVMELYGLPTDTEAYYHVDPVTGAFAPEPGDTLELQVDGTVAPGQFVTFSIANPDGVSQYILLPSLGSADAPAVLGGSGLNATRLISSVQLLPQARWIPMGVAGTTQVLALPPFLPFSEIYLQAVEYPTVFNLQTATAASNGLKSAW